ncbi:MAG: putative metal-binding motif-containing protein [Alphaproteobacteria bacterium]|nr:putative metal-binding motif-containing protein [Alphaproteobacteria bacterium]
MWTVLLLTGALAQTLVGAGPDLGDHHVSLDGRGGVFVVWEDHLVGSALFVQRLDPYGEPLWGPAGIELQTGDLHAPRITSDGVDGALVVWEDHSGASPAVWAQRIDPDGLKLWGDVGTEVTAAGQYPRAVSDSTAGLIVASEWPGVGARLHHLDSNGAASWAFVAGDAYAPRSNPELTTDEAGGALMLYTANSTTGGPPVVHARRVDSTGASPWTADLYTTYADRASDIVPDGSGGAILMLEGISLGARRLSANGTDLWGRSPGFNNPGPEVHARLAATGNSAGWAVWQHTNPDSVFIQRFTDTGVELFGPDGQQLGLGGDESDPEVAAAFGGAVAVWSAQGTTTVRRFESDGAPSWGPGFTLGSAGTATTILVEGTDTAAFVAWREEGALDELWVHQLNSDASSGCTFIDEDGDGVSAWDSCLGTRDDCDDADGTVFPGAPELCDGLDNDCDGLVPTEETSDADGDGDATCADCDDANPQLGPSVTELCDGLDNDCNGLADFGGDVARELDADGDGFRACQNDCDDGDPLVGPGFPELCDGLDNACNGLDADERDYDGDGLLECRDDCDDDDPTIGEGMPEICDGLDNDCDGLLPPDETDPDGDGALACNGDCDDTEAMVHPDLDETLCDGLDNDCDTGTPDSSDGDDDGSSSCDDCDDADPAISPLADEVCDGVDNDCDGLVDPQCGGTTGTTGDTGEPVDTDQPVDTDEPAEARGCGCDATSRSGTLSFAGWFALGRRR